jgi:hypothetical protein
MFGYKGVMMVDICEMFEGTGTHNAPRVYGQHARSYLEKLHDIETETELAIHDMQVLSEETQQVLDGVAGMRADIDRIAISVSNKEDKDPTIVRYHATQQVKVAEHPAAYTDAASKLYVDEQIAASGGGGGGGELTPEQQVAIQQVIDKSPIAAEDYVDDSVSAFESTLTGYGTRLSEAEYDIDVNTANIATLDRGKVSHSNPGVPSLYAVNQEGTDYTVRMDDASAYPSSVARRNGSGQLFVSTPSSFNHAATKQYVDDAVAAGGGGGAAIMSGTIPLRIAMSSTVTRQNFTITFPTPKADTNYTIFTHPITNLPTTTGAAQLLSMYGSYTKTKRVDGADCCIVYALTGGAGDIFIDWMVV